MRRPGQPTSLLSQAWTRAVDAAAALAGATASNGGNRISDAVPLRCAVPIVAGSDFVTFRCAGSLAARAADVVQTPATSAIANEICTIHRMAVPSIHRAR